MKALLLYPEFSDFGFWNYKEVCHLMGAKYPASPLGLITMAALLPADWEVRLVDLNTTSLNDTEIDWADWIATAVHGSLSAISHATQRGPSAFNCGMLGVETIAGLLRCCEERIVESIFIMSEPIRVAVTGAAGQIGYSLLLRIAAGAVSHFHDL